MDANASGAGSARVRIFPEEPVKGSFRFSYRMRAVFPGTYAFPPALAEALNDPGRRATTRGDGRVAVLP